MSATLSTPKTTSGGEITRELVNSTDGAGLHFDGAGYVNLTNAAGAEFGTSDFSLEFIIDQGGDNTNDNYIFYSHLSGNSRIYLYNDISADEVILTFINSSGASANYTLAYDMAADYGTPTHYVLSADRSSNLVLYKNGNSVASASIAASSTVDIGALNTTVGVIGSQASGHSVIGTFYRFRTWNKSLSQAEVTATYENATVPFADQYGSQTNLLTGIDSTLATAAANTAAFNAAAYTWASNASTSTVVASNVLSITSNASGGIYKAVSKKDKNVRFTFNVTAITGTWRWLGVENVDITTTGVKHLTAKQTDDYVRFYSNSAGATISIDATSTNLELVAAGCVSDYDLSYANPSPSPNGQSLMVRDRASAADGTSSASGVTQVTPIEQFNSKSIAVGTSVVTPADAQVHIKGADGAYGFIHEDATGVKTATYSNGSTGFIGTQSSHPLSLMVAGSGKVTIDSAGVTRLSQDATLTTLATPALMVGGTGTDSYALNAKHLIGFGYNAANTPLVAMGLDITDQAANTKGSLIFATRNTTGATDVPTTRMTIDSAGAVTIGAAGSAGSAKIYGATNGNPLTIYEDTNDHITHNLHLDASDNAGMILYAAAQAPKVSIQTAGASYFNGGPVTMPSTPAFSAQPSVNQNNIPINTATDIVFGTEIFDQGANFASNTFTAPVAGRYQLNLIVAAIDIDSAADFYQFSIVTSNRSYHYTFDPDFGQDPVYWEGGPSILADMDANDTAVVKIYQSSGTAQTDIEKSRTYFNGFLAC